MCPYEMVTLLGDRIRIFNQPFLNNILLGGQPSSHTLFVVLQCPFLIVSSLVVSLCMKQLYHVQLEDSRADSIGYSGNMYI